MTDKITEANLKSYFDAVDMIRDKGAFSETKQDQVLFISSDNHTVLELSRKA